MMRCERRCTWNTAIGGTENFSAHAVSMCGNVDARRSQWMIGMLLGKVLDGLMSYRIDGEHISDLTRFRWWKNFGCLEIKVTLHCASFVGLDVGYRMMGERFGTTDVREIQIFFNVKINKWQFRVILFRIPIFIANETFHISKYKLIYGTVFCNNI